MQCPWTAYALHLESGRVQAHALLYFEYISEILNNYNACFYFDYSDRKRRKLKIKVNREGKPPLKT